MAHRLTWLYHAPLRLEHFEDETIKCWSYFVEDRIEFRKMIGHVKVRKAAFREV